MRASPIDRRIYEHSFRLRETMSSDKFSQEQLDVHGGNSMNSSPNCDRLLGLHQDITIIYTPVEYIATFSNESTPVDIAEGRGHSVVDALADLEGKLAKVRKIDKYNFEIEV